MIVDVVMPKMGESITEGTVLEWRKKPGERIEKDEILLEIGTDKVDSEIPSAHAGILVETLAEPNQTVDVGVTIARIDTEGNAGALEEKPEVVKEVSVASPKAETPVAPLIKKRTGFH